MFNVNPGTEVPVLLQTKWLLSSAKPGDVVYRSSCYMGDPLYGYAMVFQTKKGQTLPLWLVTLNELNRWIRHEEDPYDLLKINNFKKSDYLLWLAENITGGEPPW